MQYQHKARFGQNFLKDQFVIQNILHQVAPQKDQVFIEIGPGQGALTAPLLQAGAKLTVIEIDRDLVAYLSEQYPELSIVSSDVLKINFTDIVSQHSQSARLIGNLPYNISSPLLIHILKASALFSDIHVMLQKEVVQRLTAVPGEKAYGRLSIITQYLCDIEYLLDVPSNAFEPAPKVDSAVARLTPYHDNTPWDKLTSIETLQEVVKAAFSQRRKKISNTLKSYFDKATLMSLDINPDDRAEVLTINDYVHLANALV